MAEFDTFDAFLDWFESQKPEWQPVLAARIALRALPVAFADNSKDNPLSSEDERALLQMFRAVLSLDDLADKQWDTQSQFFTDTLSYFQAVAYDPLPREASNLATLLVSYLKFIADHIEREQNAHGRSEKAFRDKRISSLQLDLVDRAALLRDLQRLDTISPSILSTMQLFPESNEISFGKQWPSLKFAMQVAGHCWEIWEQYYWGKLTGAGNSEALISAVNQLSAEDWLIEPSKINPRLAELQSVQQTGFGEEEQQEISDLTIADSESFEKWLQDKPAEWAQVLTVRCELRTLPFVELVTKLSTVEDNEEMELVFGFFRSVLIPWVALSNPFYDLIVPIEESLLSNFTTLMSKTSYFSSSHISGIKSDAFDSNLAAALYSSNSAEKALSAVVFAIANIVARASHMTRGPAHNIATDCWRAINDDAAYLEVRKDTAEIAARNLAKTPIWINKANDSSLWQLAEYAGQNFFHNLVESENNWQVWTEWYQSLFNGENIWGLTPERGELLAVRIAKQSDAWWGQGPAIVNAKIAEWLAEFREIEAREASIQKGILDEWPGVDALDKARGAGADIFQVEPGKDNRLHRVPALVRGENLAEFSAQEHFDEMKDQADDLVKKLNEQSGNHFYSSELKERAAKWAKSLSSPIIDCNPLILNKRIVWLLRTFADEVANSNLASNDVVQYYAVDLRAYYQRLEIVFPSLKPYREMNARERFELPNEEEHEAIEAVLQFFGDGQSSGGILSTRLLEEFRQVKIDREDARALPQSDKIKETHDIVVEAETDAANRSVAVWRWLENPKKLLSKSGKSAEEIAEAVKKYEKAYKTLSPHMGKFLEYLSKWML